MSDGNMGETPNVITPSVITTEQLYSSYIQRGQVSRKRL